MQRDEFARHLSEQCGIPKFIMEDWGDPRYLELLDIKISAEENIRALCFLPDSPLLNEFEFIFNDIQLAAWLNIPLDDIVLIGPYFQTSTKLIQGCQIDLLIQTKLNGVYVCEIKFSKSVISSAVIDEVKTKIKAMKILKHFSCRPILVHVNGISDMMLEKDYFSKIIDFSELLLDHH